MKVILKEKHILIRPEKTSINFKYNSKTDFSFCGITKIMENMNKILAIIIEETAEMTRNNNGKYSEVTKKRGEIWI